MPVSAIRGATSLPSFLKTGICLVSEFCFAFNSSISLIKALLFFEKAVRTALPWYNFEIYVEPDIYSAKHVHA